MKSDMHVQIGIGKLELPPRKTLVLRQQKCKSLISEYFQNLMSKRAAKLWKPGGFAVQEGFGHQYRKGSRIQGSQNRTRLKKEIRYKVKTISTCKKEMCHMAGRAIRFPSDRATIYLVDSFNHPVLGDHYLPLLR
jgi:hypothetical protein